MRRFFLSCLVALGVALWPGGQAALAAPSALGDFNGDGRADLAAGVPSEDVGTVSDTGAVNVLYGTETGLSATGNQLWHQNSAGVLDAVEPGDESGNALAAGDFNGDGRADLAVGVPSEDVGTVSDAGAVNVIYGTTTGLSATGNQLWHQDRASVADAVEPGDEFGDALAAGDFNGDGRADLAVGVPYETVGTLSKAGAVNVLYGTVTGLSATGNQLWHQDSEGVLDAAEMREQFGFALAAGDFNGDARADLVVGAWLESVGTVSKAGAVNVLYGTATGLSATGNQLWHQDSPGVLDAAEEEDLFGSTLAAGDFNDDGRADLAVGVPYEDIGTLSKAGAVNVLYGTATGLSATGDQLWHQDRASVIDAVEADDRFGAALAPGDFNGDGRDDLAVGAWLEDIETVSNAGVVNVLYGTSTGLSWTGNQLWHQDRPSVLDAVEMGDRFGRRLVAGDFNGDGRAHLVVGVPFEDVGTISDAGAVNVLYGTAAGLSATGNQLWHQDSAGVLDAAEMGDRFGAALAAGAAAPPLS